MDSSEVCGHLLPPAGHSLNFCLGPQIPESCPLVGTLGPFKFVLSSSLTSTAWARRGGGIG